MSCQIRIPSVREVYPGSNRGSHEKNLYESPYLARRRTTSKERHYFNAYKTFQDMDADTTSLRIRIVLARENDVHPSSRLERTSGK